MPYTEPHLHIRRTMSGNWVWELRTADKHVLNTGAEFATRPECESDAQVRGMV